MPIARSVEYFKARTAGANEKDVDGAGQARPSRWFGGGGLPITIVSARKPDRACRALPEAWSVAVDLATLRLAQPVLPNDRLCQAHQDAGQASTARPDQPFARAAKPRHPRGRRLPRRHWRARRHRPRSRLGALRLCGSRRSAGKCGSRACHIVLTVRGKVSQRDLAASK
jgi:hypothetical protein